MTHLDLRLKTLFILNSQHLSIHILKKIYVTLIFYSPSHLCTSKYFCHVLSANVIKTVLWALLIAKLCQVWHIMKHIKHNYTGLSWAGHNKRTFDLFILFMYIYLFITQHNGTDIRCFEGPYNCHADRRNVQQSCCPSIQLVHLQCGPWEFVSIYPSRPHNHRPRVDHTSPGSSLTVNRCNCLHNQGCTNCQT